MTYLHNCADHPVLCSVRNTFAKSEQQHKINIVTKLMKQTIKNKDEETYHFKSCRNRHLWSFSVDFFHGHSSGKSFFIHNSENSINDKENCFYSEIYDNLT